MAVNAIFNADFTNFNKAVNTATTQLKGFEGEAAKVDKGLARFGDSFSGKKIIQDALLAAKAVEDIGGATALTASEQAKLNALLGEALAKYKAVGQEAPAKLRELAAATEDAGKKTGGLSAGMVAVGSAIGGFVSGLALQGLQQLGQMLSDAAAQGVKFGQLSTGFDQLTTSVGLSSDAMLRMSRTATKGLVSDLDLIQSSNKALLLGLPVTEKAMGEMAGAAVTLGRAMGQDAAKSLDDLITALGRSSPMILDNLGLSVKVGEANAIYAAQLGKTADALTDAEKKQAFFNAAMDAARTKTEALGGIQLTVTDQLSRLATTLGNVVTRFISGANESNTFSSALGAVASAAERAEQFLLDLAEAQRRVLSLQQSFVSKQGPAAPEASFFLDPLGLGAQPDIGRVREQLESIARERALEQAQLGKPSLVTAPGIAPAVASFEDLQRIEQQSQDLKKKAADDKKKAADREEKQAADLRKFINQMGEQEIADQKRLNEEKTKNEADYRKFLNAQGEQEIADHKRVMELKAKDEAAFRAFQNDIGLRQMEDERRRMEASRSIFAKVTESLPTKLGPAILKAF